MKRWLFVLSLLLIALSLVPVAAQEALVPDEITGEVVYIPFPVAITLDGSLDDWAGVPVITVDRGNQLSPDPTQNAEFTFRVAADAENLYITMHTVDSNIVSGQHGTDYWNEDSFEFYLNLTSDRYATAYGDGMFQINLKPSDIGVDPAAVNVTGTNGASSGAQAFIFATETGWGLEAAVPLNAYLTPAHGTEIGFQAQMNGATELDRNVKLIWSLADTSDNSWNNPSLFGSGLFYEIGRTDVPVASERPEPVEAAPERYVSVNQLGYFANAPKYAMVAGPGRSGTAWVLRDAATGELITAGFTSPGALDEASGDYVQTVDFSSVTAPGTYVLQVNDLFSETFRIADDLYAALPIDAARYFYLNRSGIELDEAHAGAWARPAGHMTDDAVTCWQGTDPQGVAWDGCDYTLNARGGWYDAGDYGKYVVNGGISAWTLLNLYERQPNYFPDGSLNIPESGNGISDLLDEARWQMEFLLAMQVPEGQPLAGMVHHKLHDRNWSGVPLMPPTEYDNNSDFSGSDGRYLFPPSTAATLNVAATAAQCARIWRDIDADFAARCLTVAETAWRAANDNPIMLAGNVPGAGGGNYDDGNVDDEFYWAAAELFITTGEQAYKDFFTASQFYTAFPNMHGGEAGSLWWGGTAGLGTISLATVSNALSADEIAALQAQIITAADTYLSVIAGEGYRVSLGANSYNWGSNSDVLNNALIMALAHDFTGDPVYLNGVTESMDYLLGRNALGFSFISGYGANAMQHPHHRFWGNQGEFPPPPPGAVAGGPNGNPSDPTAIDAGVNELGTAKRYVDLIGSWSTNEVTINWNAPLVWVSAYLDTHMSSDHAD